MKKDSAWISGVTDGDKLSAVLEYGCSILQLPAGLLVQVDDGQGIIIGSTVQCLPLGTVVALRNTIHCQQIADRIEPTIVDCAQWPIVDGESDGQPSIGHCLAVRMGVGNKQYLLGYYSTATCKNRVTAGEHRVLRILANWLLHELRYEPELNNDYFRQLVEASQEGIYTVDDRGYCTFMNRAGRSLLGYGEDESLRDCIAEFEQLGNGQVLTNEHTVGFAQFHRRDGTLLAVEYSNDPLVVAGNCHDEDGRVVIFRPQLEPMKSTEEHLDYLAQRDALTGFLNRYTFEQCVQTAINRVHSNDGSQAVLCYLDLDQFKAVNDACGHAAGDELLRQLSTLLREQCRQTDLIGRIGGDEFGILFDNCHLSDAKRIVQQMLHAVNRFRFVWAERLFSISFSAGLTQLTERTESVEEAFSQADEACFTAKEQGRSAIKVYQADVSLWMKQGQQWRLRLENALAEDQFTLSAQPIQPISQGAQGTTLCYEILLRMRDDNGNVIPPGAFIPAAERFNLMPSLDRWVIDNVLSLLRNNPRHTQQLDLCMINLSGLSLADEQLLNFIVESLSSAPELASKIGFEIDESAAINGHRQLKAMIEQLGKLGCRFALDRFGSGISAMNYLKNMPVHFVKIDGQIVRDLDGDLVDQAMVDGINQIAHLLRLQTIATQVENRESLAILTALGVDFVQGIGVHPPLSLNQLIEQAETSDDAVTLVAGHH